MIYFPGKNYAFGPNENCQRRWRDLNLVKVAIHPVLVHTGQDNENQFCRAMT